LEDSTAICVIVQDSDLFVINVGDSRAVMFQGGQAIEGEKERIIREGGTVIGDSLMGSLGVSRSFGEGNLKKHFVDSRATPKSNFFLSPPRLISLSLLAMVCGTILQMKKFAKL